jgi:hypothetical protein
MHFLALESDGAGRGVTCRQTARLVTRPRSTWDIGFAVVGPVEQPVTQVCVLDGAIRGTVLHASRALPKCQTAS